jgi:hypothetical protein
MKEKKRTARVGWDSKGLIVWESGRPSGRGEADCETSRKRGEDLGGGRTSWGGSSRRGRAVNAWRVAGV